MRLLREQGVDAENRFSLGVDLLPGTVKIQGFPLLNTQWRLHPVR